MMSLVVKMLWGERRGHGTMGAAHVKPKTARSNVAQILSFAIGKLSPVATSACGQTWLFQSMRGKQYLERFEENDPKWRLRHTHF
jgi:hypothetical protein